MNKLQYLNETIDYMNQEFNFIDYIIENKINQPGGRQVLEETAFELLSSLFKSIAPNGIPLFGNQSKQLAEKVKNKGLEIAEKSKKDGDIYDRLGSMFFNAAAKIINNTGKLSFNDVARFGKKVDNVLNKIPGGSYIDNVFFKEPRNTKRALGINDIIRSKDNIQKEKNFLSGLAKANKDREQHDADWENEQRFYRKLADQAKASRDDSELDYEIAKERKAKADVPESRIDEILNTPDEVYPSSDMADEIQGNVDQGMHDERQSMYNQFIPKHYRSKAEKEAEKARNNAPATPDSLAALQQHFHDNHFNENFIMNDERFLELLESIHNYIDLTEAKIMTMYSNPEYCMEVLEENFGEDITVDVMTYVYEHTFK